jgi:hypothetical protein
MELFPGITIEDIMAADWPDSLGWRVDGLSALTAVREHLAVYRHEAFVTIYLDDVGYPAWVGEFVPDGWD